MANPYFNATYYLQNNPDLFAAGINTPEAAWAHYSNYGAGEAIQGYSSRNPAPWFDGEYYFRTNPDLAAAGLSPAQVFEHFVNHGISEGRAPSAAAAEAVNAESLTAYADANEDLRVAFGIEDGEAPNADQLVQLAQHFYQFGYKEERDGSPIDYADGQPGETFVLTTGADLASTSAASQNGLASDFRFTDANETVTAALGTLNNQDMLLDGSKTDNDVLNVSVDANAGNTLAAVSGARVANIENINVALTAAANNDALSLATYTGVKNLVMTGTAAGAIQVTNFAASGVSSINTSGITTAAAAAIVNDATAHQDLVVTTGAGADQITLGNGDNEVSAGAGNNQVTVGSGNNTINTGAGNDTVGIGNGTGTNTVTLGNGANTVNGGLAHGDNSVTGGTGIDTITLGNGNNTIDAGADNDVITLGNGNNTVDLGAGDDTVTAGSGNNTITTGAGADTVTVGNGNNTVTGGDGVDTVIAGNGANIITTGAGADVITVGTGDNTITAGAGADTVNLGAGTGVNTIVFATGDSNAAVGEFDVITGFQISGAGRDVLDFGGEAGSPVNFGAEDLAGGAVFADALAAATTAFGNDALLDYYAVDNGTDTWVFADVDGVAGIDFAVQLSAVADATAIDYSIFA